MTRTTDKSLARRRTALVASTALAATLLTGCAIKAAPPANLSATRAEAALARGSTGQAVRHAEAAVQAQPHNAAFRATLGAAYLDAGRFRSAATSFTDAMALGDASPRTAISLALALIGAGDRQGAHAILTDWRDQLDPSDLGLAFALAGDARQGVGLLSDAVRNGAATPKTRQNLAYAYALAGDWRAARLMASQDLPAGEVDQRIEQWARTIQPEAFQARMAGLLDVPVTADGGQPARLALANNPAMEQLVAEAAAQGAPMASEPATAQMAGGELPALAAPVPMEAPAPAPQLAAVAYAPAAPVPQFDDTTVAAAPAMPTPQPAATLAAQTAEALRIAAAPAMRELPARVAATVAPAPSQSAAPRRVVRPVPRAAAPAAAGGQHLVQLGSFASEQGARRAWGIYSRQYPQLRDYRMVITRAEVNGRNYYRVSAGGLHQAAVRSVCGTVRASGGGCIAWREGSPLPGAVRAAPARMARR